MGWPESETPPDDKAGGGISHHDDIMRCGRRGRFVDQLQLNVKLARPTIGAGDVLRAV
jgi:hypothetical protein